MKKINREINNKMRNRIKRILTFGVTFLIIYLTLLTSVAPQKFDYVEGDIASSDIKAPRDTVDEDATKAKLNEALDKVENKYTVKQEVQDTAEENINQLFEQLYKLSDSSQPQNEKINALKTVSSSLSNSDCEVLLSVPKNNINTVKEECISILEEVYGKNIQDGDEESLKQAKYLSDNLVDKLSMDGSLSTIIKKILEGEINPNLFYDKKLTEEVISQVEKSVENVVIKKNQIIVSEGEPITASQIKILQSLGLLSDGSNSMVLIYISLAIFVAIILYIENWYIYINYRDIYNNSKKILLINLLSIISIVLARVCALISPYIIPVACAPLLLTLLINYKISVFVNTMNIFFIATIVEFDPQVMLISIIGTLLGSTFIKKMQQRNDILYATIFIAIITAILNFAIGVFLSNNFKEIFINTLFTAGGMIFSGVFAIGILPFLEASFDVVTTLKLLELSNPNSPLLKKLLMEAPGTYHHSMLVANLAEMAAEEVGANSVVTRIGAYYHDVGKVARPYFFKENQMSKDNPHDKINGNLSTLIITSHVKDGVELAKEYKLPQKIVDIIQEHHGTTLVKYFYYKVKNSAENPDEIKEEEFMYPGPIPSSKEAGILMLADSTEAAVRSIPDPTSDKIQKMINDIVEDKLKSGQLDNCDLTLKDISKIKACFLKALNGIYHKRIEYPTEK